LESGSRVKYGSFVCALPEADGVTMMTEPREEARIDSNILKLSGCNVTFSWNEKVEVKELSY
jgi:hypothetical protein